MKKIVVIDDEVDMVDLLKAFLEIQGYEAFTATNARAGMDIIKEVKPDLVLLDVIMPQVSGLECLQAIKQLFPEMIVIVISGLQDESIAKEAIELGAYDYITKPFDLSRLKSNLLDRIFS